MRELKGSVGMWYMGATGDRFVKAGYRPDGTIEERFDAAGKKPGVRGLEIHYPTEINDTNYKQLKKRAADMNLEFVMLTPHLWVDPVYKFGTVQQPRQDVAAGGPSISRNVGYEMLDRDARQHGTVGREKAWTS